MKKSKKIQEILVSERKMKFVSWLNGLVGGLLISSCCFVQLFLNLFGVGCAGLNTVLSPYRPLFVSLTVISLSYAFYRHRPSKVEFLSILTLTLFLSFSPELVRFSNDYRSDSIAERNELFVEDWLITGMHCEACRSAVFRALKGIDGVNDIQVDLETSRATIKANRPINPNDVIQRIRSAGFDGKLIN